MRSQIIIKFFLLLIFHFAFGRLALPSELQVSCYAGAISLYGKQSNNDTLDREILHPKAPESINDNDTIPVEEKPEADEEKKKRGTGVILDSKVEYVARDSIRFEIVNQKVFLFGKAAIEYEDIHLAADFIEIDFNKNEINSTGLPDTAGIIRGLPVFTEKGQSYMAEEIRYNFETEKGRSVNVLTEEADGFLHGGVVKIMDDETVHVGSGKYTTCDDPNPHFHIGFRRAKVMDDKIVSGPAIFYIENIPTPLVIPFGFFPNTTGQASGIIIPSYGESSNRGFNLRDGGFYWGISDYVDLSLKGDIYSRGSWGLKAESRYNMRYRFSGNFNINYAVNVDGEEGLPGYSRRNDFRVVWNHNQDPRARPNSVFRANVNAGSSQYNKYDPATTEDYLSNTFQSNISYSATWREGRYNFSANLRHSQNTITQRIDMNLPELAFSVSRFYPFRRDAMGRDTRWYENISMSYNMNARNEISTTDSLFLESETWRTMSNGIRHTIPVSHSFNLLNHFNVSSSLNYTERWYSQSIERHWDDEYFEVTAEGDTIYGGVVADTIPGFKAARDFNLGTSLGTNIYGMRGFKRGPLSAIRHVMRPSVGFSYRPDFADPFWGSFKQYEHPGYEDPVNYSIFEGGIYGAPPEGRSGAINFSLANNLEIKVRSRRDDEVKDRKITLIDNLAISASYDLARDSLNFSDIVVSGRTRLFDNFDISYSSRWTPYIVDENNNRINRFVWEEKGKFLQLTTTSWNLSFNYTLSGGERRGQNGQSGGGPMRGESPDSRGNGLQGDERSGDPDDPVQPRAMEPIHDRHIDYSVPWNLRFSYNFNYRSRIDQITYEADRNYTQTLSMSGDVRLSPKWRIGVTSGYDFEYQEITYTSVNIYRDLHCWEMTINWIPFGFRKSYNLTIRVKSPVLSDLKYEQRREYFDF